MTLNGQNWAWWPFPNLGGAVLSKSKQLFHFIQTRRTVLPIVILNFITVANALVNIVVVKRDRSQALNTEKILRGFKILPNIVINKRCFAQNAQHSLSTFLYKVQLKGYSLEYRLLHKWDCMERSEPKFMFEVESNFVSSGWFTFPRWKRIWENLSQSQLTEVTTSQL